MPDVRVAQNQQLKKETASERMFSTGRVLMSIEDDPQAFESNSFPEFLEKRDSHFLDNCSSSQEDISQIDLNNCQFDSKTCFKKRKIEDKETIFPRKTLAVELQTNEPLVTDHSVNSSHPAFDLQQIRSESELINVDPSSVLFVTIVIGPRGSANSITSQS